MKTGYSLIDLDVIFRIQSSKCIIKYSSPGQLAFFCKGWIVSRSHRKNKINPLMPSGAFNICCPRDCVYRHNGGTSGAPLKPLRVDSALRALSTLRGLRGAPEVPPLCRETQSLGQQMLNAPVGINGLMKRIGLITSQMTNIFIWHATFWLTSFNTTSL